MKNHRKSIVDRFSHPSCDDDLTRLCGLMNAGCDVDAVAAQHAVVINDILDVDANPKLESERVIFATITLLPALDIASPPDRVHRTGEFRQYAISSQIGNSPAVAMHMWFNDLGPQRLPTAHGLDIVECHQTRIAGDVGKSDRNKPPRNC